MDISGVMDDLAAQLKIINGLNVYAYPPGNVTLPAAVVGYPEDITFDASFQRGMDTMTIPVFVTVGMPTDPYTRDRMTDYCAGSGDSSVKAVLESGVYTNLSLVNVKSVTFESVTISATDYVSAKFELEVNGAG